LLVGRYCSKCPLVSLLEWFGGDLLSEFVRFLREDQYSCVEELPAGALFVVPESLVRNFYAFGGDMGVGLGLVVWYGDARAAWPIRGVPLPSEPRPKWMW
jgi:hypothetical protein